MPRGFPKAKETVEVVEKVAEVVEVVETPKVVGRPYRVFDNRAGLVAQVNSIEEAEAELARFKGGFYKMV